VHWQDGRGFTIACLGAAGCSTSDSRSTCRVARRCRSTASIVQPSSDPGTRRTVPWSRTMLPAANPGTRPAVRTASVSPTVGPTSRIEAPTTCRTRTLWRTTRYPGEAAPVAGLQHGQQLGEGRRRAGDPASQLQRGAGRRHCIARSETASRLTNRPTCRSVSASRLGSMAARADGHACAGE